MTKWCPVCRLGQMRFTGYHWGSGPLQFECRFGPVPGCGYVGPNPPGIIRRLWRWLRHHH